MVSNSIHNTAQPDPLVGDTPNHHCAIPANSTLNDSIPKIYDTDGSWEWSKCSQYEHPETDDNATVSPCAHGYWFDPASGYQSTIVTDVRPGSVVHDVAKSCVQIEVCINRGLGKGAPVR